MRPLSAGWLRVLGVSWLLAGTAKGYVEFDIKGRKRKRPKGDRCARAWALRHQHQACMRNDLPFVLCFLIGHQQFRFSMLRAGFDPSLVSAAIGWQSG